MIDAPNNGIATIEDEYPYFTPPTVEYPYLVTRISDHMDAQCTAWIADNIAAGTSVSVRTTCVVVANGFLKFRTVYGFKYANDAVAFKLQFS